MYIIGLIGQIILGGFFIWSGLNHFITLEGTSGYAKSKGVPVAKFAVAFTGLMLVVGGLSILTGFATHIGAWILVIFMLLTTFTIHQFWNVTDKAHRASEIIAFAKNLAILGALLIIIAR